MQARGGIVSKRVAVVVAKALTERFRVVNLENISLRVSFELKVSNPDTIRKVKILEFVHK